MRLLFCESDDEVGDGWLTAMGQALLEHGFVAARIDYRKLNQPWLWPRDGKIYDQETELAQCPVPPYLPYAKGATFGLRRSAYETIGPLDTAFSYSVDTEYCWRAYRLGIPIRFAPDAVVNYRLRHNFKGMYLQGRTWAKDFTRLRKVYQSPLGQFTPLKQLIRIPKALPKGIWHYLRLLLKVPGSQSSFAHWVWDFGWRVGEFQGPFTPLTSLKWSLT